MDVDPISIFKALSTHEYYNIIRYMLERDVVGLAELSRALNITNKATLRKRLSKLVDYKVVNRIGKGKYSLSPDLRGVIREIMTSTELLLSSDKWVVSGYTTIPLSRGILEDLLSPYNIPRETASMVFHDIKDIVTNCPYPYIEDDFLGAILIYVLVRHNLVDVAVKLARNKIFWIDMSSSIEDIVAELMERGTLKYSLNVVRRILHPHLLSREIIIDYRSSPWSIERVVYRAKSAYNIYKYISHELLIDSTMINDNYEISNIKLEPQISKGRSISIYTNLDSLEAIKSQFTALDNIFLILEASKFRSKINSDNEWMSLFRMLRNRDVLVCNDPENYVFRDGLSIKKSNQPIVLSSLKMNFKLASDENILRSILWDYLAYITKKPIYKKIQGRNTDIVITINLSDILEKPILTIRECINRLEGYMERLQNESSNITWLVYGGGKRSFTGKVNREVDWMFSGGVTPMSFRVLDKDDLTMALTQLVSGGFRYLRLLW
jgi:hypothetical protein